MAHEGELPLLLILLQIIIMKLPLIMIMTLLLQVGGKGGRKYKGVREGGVSNNTTFYVFTHGKVNSSFSCSDCCSSGSATRTSCMFQDGAFEAFPIKDWYNFTPIQVGGNEMESICVHL